MTKQSKNLPEYDLAPEVISRIAWFREELIAWFYLQGRNFPWREPRRTAYEIIVAEILLQRTNAAKVSKAYNAFLELYPTWASLANSNLVDLQTVLKPLGLWQQKASVFQSLASYAEKCNSLFPSSRAELEQLPGISQYISSAILVTYYEQPEPMLDINMARVLERFFGPRKLADIRYDPYLQTLARAVVDSHASLKINWAILDLGAIICRNGTPLCQSCPLKKKCRYYKGNGKGY